MLASISTRVVSWNDAAEMNESVESDAFVIPSSSLARPHALPFLHVHVHAARAAHIRGSAPGWSRTMMIFRWPLTMPPGLAARP